LAHELEKGLRKSPEISEEIEIFRFDQFLTMKIIVIGVNEFHLIRKV
jgi:hypothetical protein